MPRFRLPRLAAVLGMLATAAACADSTAPGAPAPLAPGEPGQVRLICNADVARHTVSCAVPGQSSTLRADRIMGLNSGIVLASSNVLVVADTFGFDLTVANHLSYPVGTSDGVNPDPNGIRVFVVDGVHATQGTGTVTVANPDGVGAFTAADQPYFTYPGILQPDAVSPAHRWKLRFDPGVQHFTFGLYVSVPVPPGGGHVYLTVQKPAQNAVVGDDLVVRVKVDSASASISSVHATAAGRRIRLQPVDPNVVQGTIALGDLPAGPLQVVIDAATVHGDTATVVRDFIKDAPPRLTVAAPQREYVATPSLRIDFDCVDDNAAAGCSSTTASVGATTLTTGTTGIHASVSLAAYDEQTVSVQLRGVDSRGQSTSTTRQVYVESSAAFTRVDSAGAVAIDVDATRLLFAAVDSALWVHDRSAGTRTLITSTRITSTDGVLHPLGAIFTAQGNVYDWRSGTLADLGPGGELAVEGTWAAWSSGGKVVRRDLVTGDTVVMPLGFASRPDPAANGDVAFNAASDQVFRYRAGVATQVSTMNVGSMNVNPVTDGVNIAWFKTNSLLVSGQVAYWDGTAEAVFPGAVYSGGLIYATSGGWIAHVARDGLGLEQVHTRAPDGTDRQVTTAATRSDLRALGPDGTVVYANGGALYVLHAPYTAAPVRLTRDWGRVTFRGTQLLLFLGNSAFDVSY